MRKQFIILILIFALCLFPFACPALAHEGKPHNFAELWHTWSFDPLIIAGLVISAWLYLQGVFNLWRAVARGKGIKAWEAWAFAGGWFSLFVALVSPLHPWGASLFSAHMTQHEILMLVSAPLFVLSRPLVAAMWALPKGWRKETGVFIKSNFIQRIWHFLTVPFIAWTIHALALWVWHIPFLFQATLTSDLIHTLQHLSFFLSASCFGGR